MHAMTGILEVYEGGGDRPSVDLAFERWLLERAAGGVCCAFVYSWPGPVVVLGYAQDPEDVDLKWCRRRGIPVLRRLTGGTGVIYRGDLAVSLVLPLDHPWAKGVVGLYGRFLDAIEPALRAVGSEVRRKQDPVRAARVRSPICFFDQLSDTLLVGDRKAVGCAQTRRGGAVLIHAAVLLGLDPALYARVFRESEQRVRLGMAQALPGGDWRVAGRSVVAAFAEALQAEARVLERPTTPDRFLAPYAQPRWAPLPDGAIEQ
jgi:lipoate-protein ligase A